MLAVIAGLAFVGFEQSPVLGEEARNPRRTIPAATYTALAAIGALYATAAWAMEAHAGRAHVAAAAAAQGPGLLYGLSSSGALAQAAQALFMTSLFAAALSYHNVTWRYMFALSREGVLPAALSRTSRSSIPRAASLIQSGSALAVIVLFAAARWPAMNGLFFGGGAMGGLGVMILLALTSAAVIRYLGPPPRRGERLGADDRPGPVRPAAGRRDRAGHHALRHAAGHRPRVTRPRGCCRRRSAPPPWAGCAGERSCAPAARRCTPLSGSAPTPPGRPPSQREDAAMTTHDRQAGSADHVIVRAGQADIGVLAQVIADAFFSLAVCRWLIPDGPARRAAFPGYFGLYVEHAIADGLVETTPDRDAAALWIPGDGPGAPPDEYAGQLAAITGPHLGNFLAFDQHWTGTTRRAPSITTWPSSRSARTARARASAPRCCTPITPSLKTRASRPTWRRRTNAPAASTSITATPTGAARSNSPAGCGCTRCGASRAPQAPPDNGRSRGGARRPAA